MSGSRPGRLGDEDIRERVASCPGWDIEGGKLHRRLEFPNFVAAFGFMTRVALLTRPPESKTDEPAKAEPGGDGNGL